jgi:hypothetical protein
MNRLLTTQLQEVIASRNARPELRCESQLRIAASMLRRAEADEMSATTVVGTLGRDDVAAFEALVVEIGDELDLDARVRLHVGSFSVRFTRRTDGETEARRI